MTKSGLIIEANVTDKGLNNWSVFRASIKGEDWVANESNQPDILDMEKWMELMVGGITTVIQTAHDLGLKDSAKFLREVIAQLEDDFVQPSNTSTSMRPERYGYRADEGQAGNDTIGLQA